LTELPSLGGTLEVQRIINTLVIQDTLADPEWADRLGDADRRGLTPLFTVK
jgi:hypothetical protein